jgi:hypothetical protein
VEIKLLQLQSITKSSFGILENNGEKEKENVVQKVCWNS